MDVVLELVGRLIAHQFERVASFDERLAFRRQAFQLDGLDLAAVLSALRDGISPDLLSGRRHALP
jgi:hypothetical protein